MAGYALIYQQYCTCFHCPSVISNHLLTKLHHSKSPERSHKFSRCIQKSATRWFYGHLRVRLLTIITPDVLTLHSSLSLSRSSQTTAMEARVSSLHSIFSSRTFGVWAASPLCFLRPGITSGSVTLGSRVHSTSYNCSRYYIIKEEPHPRLQRKTTIERRNWNHLNS